jgi:hypothetical protein
MHKKRKAINMALATCAVSSTSLRFKDIGGENYVDISNQGSAILKFTSFSDANVDIQGLGNVEVAQLISLAPIISANLTLPSGPGALDQFMATDGVGGCFLKSYFQFFVGSTTVTDLSRHCSIVGGVPKFTSLGTGILLESNSLVSIVSLTTTDTSKVFFVLDGVSFIEMQLNETVYLENTKLWSIYVENNITATWNIRVQESAITYPTIVLQDIIHIESGETPPDIVAESTLVDNFTWISSKDETFITFTTFAVTGNTLPGTELGTLSGCRYVRTSNMFNAVALYSNTILVCVTTFDPFNLNDAGEFCLFTGAGNVTNTGTTTHVGLVGTNGGSVFGLGAENVFTNDALTTATASTISTVYDDLQTFVYQSHVAAFAAGETLTPGYYKINSAGSMPAGTLTLDGQGDAEAVFVIVVNGAFAVAANAHIVTTGEASSASVYFAVAAALSFGADCTIDGTFLTDQGAIAIGANCLVPGRLYTNNGAVTLADCDFTNETFV